MLSLDNGQLEVQLLHPVDDRERFGVRYCTGGYIFQVRDPQLGDLLSGPTFPDSFNWFDGQGIPDAFNFGPLHSRTDPGEALILGIGRCDLRERTVKAFCEWSLQRQPDAITFETEHAYEGRALTLTRTVSLQERTVRSRTRMTNTGRGEVSVRWFPHPFYPQPATDQLLWVNAPLRWQDGNGYTRLRSGFIARTGWPWKEGHYLALDHEATAPLVLLQRHPALGLIGAACSYAPGLFPVWGNERTFSWEPFYERTAAPGQTLDWWIDYFF